MAGHGGSGQTRSVVRVRSFRRDGAGLERERFRSTRCRVLVTHASVGVTDLVAHRGDYLLHPRPGFVSGYDFVGVLERVDRAGATRGLGVGQRVAGILPRMGAHASHLDVPESLLVPVPDTLDSGVAATLPLDVMTARRALNAIRPGVRSVFVQGVTGAVGLLAAQLARTRAMRVVGTASPASSAVAERFGAVVVDYRGDWARQVLDGAGALDAAIDHTGSRDVARVVAPRGTIVRTAFGGAVGHQKAATAAGAASTLVRRGEVLCSVPFDVAVRRAAYRRDLRALFDDVAAGDLLAPEPVPYPVERFRDALHAAGGRAPGTKVVLTFDR